ncbi:LOW QUALITY PROTEIN: octopamine receptor 1 [Tribolium castaneum]|uniref:LOW QUALITY PROTEIN: octopamine receptor 1 n=1 Tax=Tribolium castaneum TaxID=7070 RepID=UPI0030FE430E
MSNESSSLRDPPLTTNSSVEDSTTHIQKLALAGLLSVVIVVVIIGNTLVILAVITTKRLRTVTNCFVMSLAIADWLVGVFVMPPAVANTLMGAWELGWVLCDIWVSLDILLCTASILSLCAISVDRYLAVTQPLSYSRRRRSKRLAFTMILVVWMSSALITCPPMFGWYEPGRHEEKNCRYNKNTGYVIFSAMGSFFIPMMVMLYVYVRISCVVAQRHDQLAHIDTHSRKSQKLVISVKEESDIDRVSSECEDQNLRCPSGQSAEPLNQSLNHEQRKSLGTRSLRSPLNYSFNHEPLTAQRSASLYRPQPFTPQRSRPESLNFEPATRVSSFRRETKTAQTLSIVMGGFIACWLPFFIFYLLTPFIPSNQVNSLIMSYLTWLGWFNSAINPFIYAFYSPDFRIAFWRLTVKHFSKTRRPTSPFSTSEGRRRTRSILVTVFYSCYLYCTIVIYSRTAGECLRLLSERMVAR